MSIDATQDGQLVIHGKKFSAKIYDIEGEQIEVYRIGALAHALGKNSRTVEGWEREGLFPKPVFQMIVRQGDGHCKRWYSRGQILNIYKVWMLFPLTRGRPDTVKKNFFDTVKKVFYKLNEISITVEHKHVEQQRQQNSTPSVRGTVSAQRPGQSRSRHSAAASSHPGATDESDGTTGQHDQQRNSQGLSTSRASTQRPTPHSFAKR